jgi:hypothetical protein
MLVKSYPKNKEYFLRLKLFCQEILNICRDLKIKPILYGSLAYFGYTKLEETYVNDIDFLIPENSFTNMIDALKNTNFRYKYSEKWHTLQIFNKGLKIEFDSIEFWQKDLPININKFDFEGLVLNSVSLDNLKTIYKKASEVSKDNPEGYHEKFKKLKELK